MILLFLISSWITLIITRIISHKFHDRKNYGTKKENSKTITGWLRRKTRLDWHHIHIGIIILFISCLLFILKENLLFLISSGIGTSLILDQIFPLMNFGDYFSKKMAWISIFLHLLISLIILLF